MRSQMDAQLRVSPYTEQRPTRPPLHHKSSVLSAMTVAQARNNAATEPRLKFDHHPAFLIYPIIYVVCTMPLALGRVGSLAGANVPLWYFCVAGALITSNGWLDVLLWGTTRHTIVFGPIDNADALGLETFDFMRTPPDREFGNIVWVQGAGATEAGRAGGGARKGRTWWALVDRFLGGGETGAVDEDGRELSSSQSHHGPGFDSRGSGMLGRPDHHSTYRPGHVKYATGIDHSTENLQYDSASRIDRGIAVKKDTVVTVVRVDNDLESYSSTPRGGSLLSSSYSMDAPGQGGYF